MLFSNFTGLVWRILPQTLANTPTVAARAPQGRFHHSGQIAAYASLSAEGASVAIQRYLSNEIERVLIPMQLNSEYVVDERGNNQASVVWQDIVGAGETSPTWALSDAARSSGAQAMLYSSRSRPELSHVVVFQIECLKYVGPATEFRTN